jgi:hypothetical protein
MKKFLAFASGAVLTLLAVLAIQLRATRATPGPTQLWSPGCVATIPKSWGQFKGGDAQSGLAFEDNTGTLRFLTNIPCGATPSVALEVRRSSDTSSGGAQ